MWIPRRGFRILCQRSLDSGFQSTVRFQIPWAVFQIPKPKILDSTAKICWIRDSTSKNFPIPESGFLGYQPEGFFSGTSACFEIGQQRSKSKAAKSRAIKSFHVVLMKAWLKKKTARIHGYLIDTFCRLKWRSDVPAYAIWCTFAYNHHVNFGF